MLKQRIITAVLLAALFLTTLFFASPWIFVLFVVSILAVSAWEWANLCGLTSQVGRVAYALSFLVLSALCWWCIYQFEWFSAKSLLVAALCWWAIALLWVQGYPSSAVLWRAPIVRMLMGACVLVPAVIGTYELRFHSQGVVWVIAVVAVVAAADSGAYFTGRAFGRTKLSPSVSPGKSWEGVAGGALLVSLLAVVFALVWSKLTIQQCLIVAVSTGLVSVLGDLLESMLKRHRGIKDSSQLLPGHGGVLDRVDGLVAAIPVFALTLSVWW